MKIGYIFAAVIGATFCLAGCYSLDTATFDSENEHVVVRNYGWYLFNSIPLVCGNAAPDRSLPFVCFRDDVTMDKIQKRFTDYTATRGVHATELNFFNAESVMLELPSTTISFPLPYLICYREIQLSGVLVPKKGPVK